MKNKVWLYATLGLIAAVMLSGYIVMAAAGGTDDPLISKSYLESALAQSETALKEYVDQKAASGNGTAAAYQAIFVEQGKNLIGGEGCEVILRSGVALSIAAGDVGLVDATGGEDVLGGIEIPKNHVFIIPRADGRGLAMTTDCYVMVKGSYTIH